MMPGASGSVVRSVEEILRGVRHLCCSADRFTWSSRSKAARTGVPAIVRHSAPDYSLLITHYSLLITHHSSLITHHSSMVERELGTVCFTAICIAPCVGVGQGVSHSLTHYCRRGCMAASVHLSGQDTISCNVLKMESAVA